MVFAREMTPEDIYFYKVDRELIRAEKAHLASHPNVVLKDRQILLIHYERHKALHDFFRHLTTLDDTWVPCL